MENRLPLEGSRKSHPARGGLMSRQKCGIVGAPRPSVMWFGHSTKSGASEGCGAPPPALRRALQPRWKRCLTQINDQMGEALGEMYVKKYFPEEAKQKINLMVDNLTAILIGFKIN